MKNNLLFCFILVSAFIFNESWAQERTVSGKVSSVETGEALPGVNVVLKGTTKGTVTDIDGNYKLAVPSDGGTLVFSFIGLASEEVKIGGRSIIDIQMSEDIEQLSEVVVTGYGTEIKRDLTGSIANVSAEEIEKLPVQSFDRALQGRAAGVLVQNASGQPGGAVNIQIRGTGSLSNNTPLYIVDGVQMNTNNISGQASSSPLTGINPNDVASIEVLKDAAAAAIYGAQSANGVVIITTKRGSEDGATNFEFSMQRGVVQPMNLYDVMNAQQFAEIKEEAYQNAGLNPASPGGAYDQFGDPNDPSSLTPYDWVDAMFRNGDIFNANLRISGGNKNTSYNFSLSHEEQEGQLIQSDWDRQTMSINLSIRPDDKLTISPTMNLSRQNFFGAIANGNFVNGPFVSGFLAQPNSPALDPETGEYNPYPAHVPQTGAGHLFNYNILQGVYEERRESYVAKMISSLNVSYKFFPFLTLNVLGGLDYTDSENINERPATIPVFASFGGQTSVDNRRFIDWNASATLNFSKSFNDVHNVSAIVGVELKESIAKQEIATVRGFPNTELRLLSQGTTFQNITGTFGAFQREGAFMRLGYNYNNKYYINGTVRRDGHSRFGAQNRVGTFWSVGTSWRIIEESFLSNVQFLDDLKLRFSYGILGNAQGITNYQAIPSFTSPRQYLGNGVQQLQLANDQLTWEESEQLNIGIDYAFFGNRLYGSFDWFRNDTREQLFPVPITDDSGFGNLVSNAGEVRNQGFEIELSSVNIDRGDFKWTTTFNLTKVENELTELPDGQDRIGNTLIVGEPISFYWGAPYAGVNPANGKPMWIKADGTYSYGNLNPDDDGQILGDPLPDWFGGFFNTFSYKGLKLDVFFQYQLEAQAFNGDLFNLAEAGGFNSNELVSQLDRWQQPGDITNVPIAYEGGVIDGFSTQSPSGALTTGRYVSDAGYVRLKQVTLSYDLPISLINRVGLRGVTVFVQGLNLLTFTEYDGIDPEVVLQNNATATSTYGAYPVGRQYSGGLTIKF